MKYYEPKYFKPQEIFPWSVILAHTYSPQYGDTVIDQKIWRLMDWRILWTMDKIRERFGPTIMNDYLWGGKNQYRGFRSIVELVEINKDLKNKFSLTSQHCFGRGADSKNPKYSAEEIREDIKKHPNLEQLQYITAVEADVDWLHVDCRSLVIGSDRVFFKV